MNAFKKLPLSYQFAILLLGLACIAALKDGEEVRVP